MSLLQRLFGTEPVQSRYIRCEYRNGVSPDDAKVQGYLRQLQRVPESLQEIMAKEGAYIVFFNGPMTDNPELAHRKGKVIPRWVELYGDNVSTFDYLSGIHIPKQKAVLMGIHGVYVPGRRDIFLHELGHSFDDLVGTRMQGMSLSATDKVKGAIQTEPFDIDYCNHPREYVAQTFADLCWNRATRRELRQKHPQIHKLLSEIEKKAELARKGSLEQTT